MKKKITINQSANTHSYQEELDQWVKTEFRSVDLNDGRLNKRLISIMKSFCSLPNGSIPEATGIWSKTKAAYRFLNNKKVTHGNILKPHQDITNTRIGKENVALAVQDTTSLNYTHLPETEGLGNISTDQKLRGILVHTTLAFTPTRVPLGIIHQQTWIRPQDEYGKSHQRHKKSVQEKESQKWINSLNATKKVQEASPNTLLINIGDREADMYELFHQSSIKNNCCHLLVRAAWNRRVEHPEKYLWSFMETQPVATTLQITVPRKGKKRERIAHVNIQFASVILKPPRHNPTLPPIKLWAIYVKEPSSPEGEQPLAWMLLTTLKVDSLENALQYIQYYTVRFSIELFHKVLKSGCNIEERQLQTADGLIRCLALDSIVAWRILFLTMIGRSVPYLPCTVIFDNPEWKSLYCYSYKTKYPPSEPLSLRQSIGLLAKLGGFLGRKRDGNPGPKVLWRGLQKLTYISVAWDAFGPESKQTDTKYSSNNRLKERYEYVDFFRQFTIPSYENDL